METVNLHRLSLDRTGGLTRVPDLGSEPCIATLGTFECFHRGHRGLLETMGLLSREASGTHVPLRVLSFYPTPRTFFSNQQAKASRPKKPNLFSLRHKLRTLGEHGVDDFLLLRFNKATAGVSAEQFVEEFLIKTMRVSTLVVGPDAAVGKDRRGTVEFLADYLPRFGAELKLLPFTTTAAGDKVGSSSIRKLLAAGKIREATRALGGQAFRLDGVVRSGRQLGRTIGVPTLNVRCPQMRLIPKGVYAVRVNLRPRAGFIVTSATSVDADCWYHGVMNLGVKPTVSGSELGCEVFVPNESLGDCYGMRASIQVIDVLREERKFESLEGLQVQIAIDTKRALEMLVAAE